MEKIIDLSWIMSSRKLFLAKNWPPLGWREMTETDWANWRHEWGEQTGYQWQFKGHLQKVFLNQTPYKIFDVLANETGFLVFPEVYWSAEAKILNGDLSERCVMKPIFNVRGFTPERLEVVKAANVKERGEWIPIPHFKQQVRANRTRTDGIVEIEGNDGIADCMYLFDETTGVLVGAEPYAWAD